jgi:peptidoglycan/LPS O-acetylase OafA/YrhL
LGVLAFFVISGFLITKSLVYSKNLADFYAKRLSRIWPLFIVAATFVFIFLKFVPAPIVSERTRQFYTGERTIIDLIGTIFFLEDLGFEWIDGVYWSILVELKFYLFIGLMAAIWPASFDTRFAAAAALLGLDELSCELFLPERYLLAKRLLNGVLIAQYLPFFAVGVLLFTRRAGHLLTLNIILVLAFMGTKIASDPNFELTGTLRFMVALVALLAVDIVFLRERIFLFLGKYSYSLYLFHQMIGLAIINMLAARIGFNAAVIAAFTIVLAISVVMSELFEWRWRAWTQARLTKLFSLLTLDRLRLQSRPAAGAPAPAVAQTL